MSSWVAPRWAADDHLVERDGARAGPGRVSMRCGAAAVEVAAGGEVHDRVGAVVEGDFELAQLAGFVRRRRGRCRCWR